MTSRCACGAVLEWFHTKGRIPYRCEDCKLASRRLYDRSPGRREKRRISCRKTYQKYKESYRAKAAASRDPVLARLANIKRLFGLSEEDYFKLLRKQENACGICRKPSSELKRNLSVDHCHVSGRVRGLLCGNCNSGIGKLKDSVELLKRALLYLTAANLAEFSSDLYVPESQAR